MTQRPLAARYVRMSTDHQKYSIYNQIAAIDQFASARDIEIVRTYADEGRSGLTLTGRPALTALLDDVTKGTNDFGIVLVYDISRWGRFQDSDEAAAHEMTCKRAGVQVHYCAEPFENDGSMMSMVVKAIKRAMAGEYSRELSVKVHSAHVRGVAEGYWQGALAGYGLRRASIDEAGRLKNILEPGDYKNLRSERVVLVPGPPEEIGWVRWIFQQYVRGKSPRRITLELTRLGVPPAYGTRWTMGVVERILCNEKYIGNLIWNKTSVKLQQPRKRNAQQHWVRREGVFEPIVEKGLFDRASALRAERTRRPDDEELLQKLKLVLAREGRLNSRIIHKSRLCPARSVYENRFSGLLNAYRLIGYKQKFNGTPNHMRSIVVLERNALFNDLATELGKLGGSLQCRFRTWAILNGSIVAFVSVLRSRNVAGTDVWVIRSQSGHMRRDVTIVRRLDRIGQPIDYVLLWRPQGETWKPFRQICADNANLSSFQTIAEVARAIAQNQQNPEQIASAIAGQDRCAT